MFTECSLNVLQLENVNKNLDDLHRCKAELDMNVADKNETLEMERQCYAMGEFIPYMCEFSFYIGEFTSYMGKFVSYMGEFTPHMGEFTPHMGEFTTKADLYMNVADKNKTLEMERQCYAVGVIYTLCG
jgi:hypothetical protein